MDCISKINGHSGLFDGRTPVIDRALAGWVRANTGLVLLEGRRTVLRRDYRLLKKVRILSGGWSGFEPMPIGFVGPGMLTAAVVSEKYNAPSHTNILSVIRELNSIHGVLVIVMNHPSLKVNFSLAVDIAKRENIPVKLVFVSDDCSGNVDRHGRKGVAGTALIFKLAGAMAEKNLTLEEIHHNCAEICSGNLSTVTVNVVNEKCSAVLKSAENMYSVDDLYRYESSSIDDYRKAILIKADMTESFDGTPVHKIVNIDDLTKTLIGYVIDGSLSPYNVVMEPDKNIVLLINNYGSVLYSELNALASELSNEIENLGIKIDRVFIGSVITSSFLGFSVSVMKVTNDLVSHLDHPTDVSSWPSNVLYQGVLDITSVLPRSIRGQYHYTLDKEVKLLGPILSEKQVEKLYRMVEYVAMALISCEQQINKMCHNSTASLYGTSVKAGAEAISTYLYENKLHLNCPYAFLKRLSTITATHLQDVSGSCYAVFFEGASQAFLPYFNQSEVNMEMWIDALESGIKAIEFFTQMRKGERTMLDALYPALETMKKLPENYTEIAEAAELGSLKTVDGSNQKHMLPDPGSHTVAIWIRAAVEGLNLFNKQGDMTSLSGDFYDDDSNDFSIFS